MSLLWQLNWIMQILQMVQDVRMVFPPLNNTSLFNSLDAGYFCFRGLKVLSFRGTVPLDILPVNNFIARFTFLFSINKANLDNSPMVFHVLMWYKHDRIDPYSVNSSSVLSLLHKSVLLSNYFRWSFALDALLYFWRRRLGMISIALKAIL